MLSAHLKEKRVFHRVTREPGGTPLADEIRSLLLSSRAERVFPETELLLYEAARAQHVRGVILPALASGQAVLCDRFYDATSAYQGFSRGIEAPRIDWLNAFASAGLSPDLTFLLDVSPEDGFARVHGRGMLLDRMEVESIEFHRKVREGYLRLQAAEPDRVLRIDAALPPEKVFRRILEAVAERFGW